MSNTKIEWATKVWNPLRGCSKVSEGCRNCYAIRQAHRFSGEGQPYEGLTEKTSAGINWTGKVKLVPEMLDAPLKWNKPERVFVNSMSDLFHEDVPFEYIDRVFAVMALASQHIFQILTKRPERMLEYFAVNETRWDKLDDIIPWMQEFGWLSPDDVASIVPVGIPCTMPKWPEWPLPNVWLGVSVENQKAADERIPLLLQTPAAIRFLSMEPLLGPVDLRKIQLGPNGHGLTFHVDSLTGWANGYNENSGNPKIMRNDQFGKVDWVIVGGESGPGARPMHPDWARSIRDQCQQAGIPFFFKQWGEWAPAVPENDRFPYGEFHVSGDWVDDCMCEYGTATMQRVGKKTAGRLLNGREWNEYPEVSQ